MWVPAVGNADREGRHEARPYVASGRKGVEVKPELVRATFAATRNVVKLFEPGSPAQR